MSPEQQIEDFLASLPESKQIELEQLHLSILEAFPGVELWFNDGLNDEGKVVTNPTIGYDRYTIAYADGSSKDFYRIGLSANKTGISVYVLGLDDKELLRTRFAPDLGKATVTGYCIRFKKLADINVATLQAAIRYGIEEGDEA